MKIKNKIVKFLVETFPPLYLAPKTATPNEVNGVLAEIDALGGRLREITSRHRREAQTHFAIADASNKAAHSALLESNRAERHADVIEQMIG